MNLIFCNIIFEFLPGSYTSEGQADEMFGQFLRHPTHCQKTHPLDCNGTIVKGDHAYRAHGPFLVRDATKRLTLGGLEIRKKGALLFHLAPPCCSASPLICFATSWLPARFSAPFARLSAPFQIDRLQIIHCMILCRAGSILRLRSPSISRSTYCT